MTEDQINTILTSPGKVHLDVRHLTKPDVDLLGKFSGDSIYFGALPQLDKSGAEAFLLLDRDKIRINELFVSEYLESLSLSMVLRLSRFVVGYLVIDDIPIDAPEISLFNEFKGKQFLTRIKPGEINTAKAIAQVEAELVSVYSESFSGEIIEALSKSLADSLQVRSNDPIKPEDKIHLMGYQGTLIVSVPDVESARLYRKMSNYLDVVDADISMSVADELAQKTRGSIILSGIEKITPAVLLLMKKGLVPIKLPNSLN